MSEQDQEQKTEEPSERRKQKAREDGQVARSGDLVFAVMLLCCAGWLKMLGAPVAEVFRRALVGTCSLLPDASDGDALALSQNLLTDALKAMLPLFLLLLPLCAVATLGQIGLHFVPEKLGAKLERLQPRLKLTTFVNGRSLIETATSVVKLFALGAAFWLAVKGELEALMATADARVLASGAVDLTVKVLLQVGGTLLAIGVLDFFLKHRQQQKELRMTREEVKQEAKDAMGDPEAKARIRGRQRQMAMQRMMEQVPKATVVVTNPTHYAVALQYQQGMIAPVVLAKGRDFVALRIRELARAAGVPVVENPPLARALFQAARPGDEIPTHLYQAVAAVLAAVMRAKNRPRARQFA